MKIKIFDYEHEEDLEDAVNKFIKDKIVLKILYQTSHFQGITEQIFSFSVLIYYE